MTRAETAAFLREHDNYCILTHRRPDGDTIGSSAALCLGLRAMGKTAWLLRNPQFTPRFAAVLDGLVCEDVPDEATIVSVDVAAPDLLPIRREELAAQVQLVIDHHARSSVSAEHRLVEAERAACGEIIIGLLELLGVSLDARMAEAIYIAISTDTGCFQYSNTTAETLRIAADCRGTAVPYAVNQMFFGHEELRAAEARGAADRERGILRGREGRAGGVAAGLARRAGRGRGRRRLHRRLPARHRGRRAWHRSVPRDVEDGSGKLSLRTSGTYDACEALPGSRAAAAMPRRPGATVPGGIAGAKRAILDVLRRKGIISRMANGILISGQARGLDQPGRGGEAARRVPSSGASATAARSTRWPPACSSCSWGGRRGPSSLPSATARNIWPGCASAL